MKKSPTVRALALAVLATGCGSVDSPGTDDQPATITVVSGDSQAGHSGAPLRQPVIFRVDDRSGNPSPGVTVDIRVSAGSLDRTRAVTDAAGQVAATWTMPSGTAELTLTASVSGNPVLEATASAVSVDPVITGAPAAAVQGEIVTLTGSGLMAAGYPTTVSIDNVEAPVRSATPSSLTLEIPSFNCRSRSQAAVVVSVAGLPGDTVDFSVAPPAFNTDLSVGERVLLNNTTSTCFQNPGGHSNARYLVGVGSPVELPTQLMPVRVDLDRGETALTTSPARTTTKQPAMSHDLRAYEEPLLDQLRFDLRMREWDRDNYRRPDRASALRSPDTPGKSPPSVGDTLSLKLPIAGDNCPFVPVDAEVVAMGQHGIFLSDLNNPTADQFTLGELQEALAKFDNGIFDADTTYFGAPTDLDGNGRILMLFSIEVNKVFTSGFVTSRDFMDPADCASSNFGEIFYGAVPDPENVSGNQLTHDFLVSNLPSLLAHEFTHILQVTHRLYMGDGINLNTWLGEGQALIGEEASAHQMLGNSPYQNLSYVDVEADGGYWYRHHFTRLSWFFGRHSADHTKSSEAPEECTLFGNFSINSSTPCDPAWFYGASWSFLRFLSDKYGQAYTGGETNFHRDLIAGNPTLAGIDNIEALTGVTFDSLFADWSAALYVDDLGGTPDYLSFDSWNLQDVLGNLGNLFGLDTTLFQLDAEALGASGDASLTANVRGGSFLQVLVDADDTPFSIRVEGLNGPLPSGMSPQIWILRLR